MLRRNQLFAVLIFLSFASCNGNSEKNSNADSTVKTNTITKDSIPAVVISGIKNVEELLPQIPLLKFPLVLRVDSFVEKAGIELSLNQNLPWFAGFLEFHAGTKVKAMGKFYLDAKTQAILFLTRAPGDYPERPDDVELILSVYSEAFGTVDSRILAISSAEVYGNSIMRNPNKGKSFVESEMEDISITFQDFTIKDAQFVLGETINRKFAGNQMGSDSSGVAIEEFMK